MAENVNRSEVEQQFSEFNNGVTDLSPVMPEYRQILDSSIQRNFQLGGRFGTDNAFGGGNQRWVPAERALKEGGQTMLDEGQLAASVDVRIEGDKLVAGSNKIYFPIHQLGGIINHPGGTRYIIGPGGRAVFVKKSYKGKRPIAGVTPPHQISIIARPIVVVQEEDFEDMLDATLEHYSDLFE